MTNSAAIPAEPDDFTRLVNGYAETGAGPAAAPEPPAEPSSAADTSPTPDELAAAKRAIYEEYLKSEGTKYKVDEDGDISIRREGRWLVLFASDDDSQHFRLSFPAFWECESEAESAQALELVNQMNKSYKVIRFVLVDAFVWANVEMYVDPLSAFRGTFDRCADLLCETTAEFRRRIRQAMKASSAAGSENAEQRELLCDDCAAKDRA